MKKTPPVQKVAAPKIGTKGADLFWTTTVVKCSFFAEQLAQSVPMMPQFGVLDEKTAERWRKELWDLSYALKAKLEQVLNK